MVLDGSTASKVRYIWVVWTLRFAGFRSDGVILTDAVKICPGIKTAPLL